jgi:hypothetical protein
LKFWILGQQVKLKNFQRIKKTTNGYKNSRVLKNKSFLYPDFTNRPDQKPDDLNPGDSANPDTTIKFLFLHRFNFKVNLNPLAQNCFAEISQPASFAMPCSHDPLELMRFAEGNASAAELAKIQQQLHACHDCQKQLAELLETAATLKQLHRPELAPEEVERWVHHLRRARKPQPARLPAAVWLRRLRPAPVVALLAFVLLLFSYNLMQQKPVVTASSQEELRLFLREHAIAQDQGAFTTETLSALLLTENGRGSDR